MPRQPTKLNVSFDRQGHLQYLSDWSPEVAAAIAASDGISLGEEHWEIIGVIRDYYHQFNHSPPMRVLVKAVTEKLGKEKGRSQHLMLLFPGKTLRLISKIAGLPKPVNCD